MKLKLIIAVVLLLAIPNVAFAAQKTYPVKVEGKPTNKGLTVFVKDVTSDILFKEQITIKFKP